MSASAANCPFCKRIAAGEFDFSDEHAVAFEPLNPVTPGHLLVVPRQHVRDAGFHPLAASRAMHFAAQLAGPLAWAKSYNLITSAGSPATQTVMHLHIHIVPREEGDGLHLPWTGQQPAANSAGEGSGGTRLVTSPNAPRPADPLVREVADSLRRIEYNYAREGSGPGSRFEGRLLEDVQSEWAVREVRHQALEERTLAIWRDVRALMKDYGDPSRDIIAAVPFGASFEQLMIEGYGMTTEPPEVPGE